MPNDKSARHEINRRRLLGAATMAAGLAVAAPRLSFAQAYPSRPVRVIMPFTAGGAPDVLLRLVAQKLSEKWGHNVVVENRAGGNTLIGTVAVTKSAPDGYTLLMTADQTFILNPLLYTNLPYSMKELDPIVLMASIPHMLAVSQKVPVSNVKELIALARQKPGTLTFGTTGAGTIQRIATEYFAGIAGIKLVHVPYRGANETTIAILSGEIDMTINGMSNILPHIAGGKLKALAISTLTRHRLAPGIPTMQEAGVPGYSSQGAFGLFAPAGVPREVREKISADIAEILKRPDVIKALEDRSFQVDNVGPDGFAKMIAAETEKWAKVIRAANIKGD
jgi:tripartite-type tricarboxylate transporter receptor subunit TctC